MRFEFSTSNRIIFGAGSIQQIGEVVRGWGKRALLIHGMRTDSVEKVVELLSKSEIECFAFSVEKEPTTGMVMDGVRYARVVEAQFVMSIGGGSAIDFGKAVSAVLANTGDLMDYLEVVGAGKPLLVPALPFVAIPTTSGTGSEVTKNAVLSVEEKQVKVSLRSNYLLPKVALVDPELTFSLPPSVTASTGMDALTQLIEPFVSSRSNWLIDDLCRDGIMRIARALPGVYRNPSDSQAREAMSYASMLSGIALANAGLGAVHGFAAPIGGMFHAPHGAICARLLPVVFQTNIRALQIRDPGSEKLLKYHEVSRILTGNPSASFSDGVEWLNQLCRQLEIPDLRAYGVKPEHFEVLVEKAAVASSMKANPVLLTPGELGEILEKAL